MARFNRVESLTLGVGKWFLLLWVLVSCSGSFAGWTFQLATDVRPKDWIATWTFAWITGPKAYLGYLWEYIWAFRISLVVAYFYINSKKIKKAFIIYSCDVLITLMFFPVYWIILEIHDATGFKISGHCFILSLALWMLRREGEVSVIVLKKTWVRTFLSFVLAYHYFILFFTCFAYHTFLEISAGSLLGVVLSRSIWHLIHLSEYLS